MKTINGSMFKIMLESGANNLTNHHHEIDALNVFPVPDGDTGTNMNLTFASGIREAKAVLNDHVGDIAKVLSKGLLMGARGNSGVILSQIFRGFYQAVDGKASLNVKDISEALVKGTEIAYKAVMRPVEGTILTVLRESGKQAQDYLQSHPDKDILEYFDFLIQSAHESLQNTPELLPILKEVGVVDSGGAGYVTILEGFRLGLKGTPVQLLEKTEIGHGVQTEYENAEFGYCTEFILKISDENFDLFDENKLRNALARIGESIVVVQDEDIVKVHVHTLAPGEALNLGQRYGEFLKLKIENMQQQHEHIVEAAIHKSNEMPKKKYALIAVAAGEGIRRLFEEYRVDVVISGGQTMNPSTEDFVAACRKVNADHIFILPNNSNIILAAQQAESILDEVDVRVLTSKSIPQGLSACIMFNPEVGIDENLAEMKKAIKHVKTGQVTYAIKDTVFEGMEISAGDYMGIFDKNIVVSTKDKVEATKTLLEELIDKDSEIITVLVGEDVSEAEQSEIDEFIAKQFPSLEVETIQGQQPVYSFIFGVE
ncbi:MAG: DAK2 domain-containing protein [Erysipelotrichales bacterium]|nr:MAG: DAK2 domain-containing protein [Erysipelotrichales bacterium]